MNLKTNLQKLSYSLVDNNSVAEVEAGEKQAKDFLAEYAIQQGIEQARQQEAETKITLKFSDRQVLTIEKLTSALGMSVQALLDSAINLVFDYSKKKQVSVKDIEAALPNIYDSSTPVEFSFELTLIAENQLEKLEMKDRINDCVVLGIEMLGRAIIDGLYDGSQLSSESQP